MLKVLVVDDMALMCQMIKDSLNKFTDIECSIKTTFAAAEFFLSESAIDLAIIDLSLGDESGVKLVHQIRSAVCRCRHDIPILVISGNTYKSEIESCITLDVQEIIAKPLQPARLIQHIQLYRNKELYLKPAEFYQSAVSMPASLDPKRYSPSVVVSPKQDSPQRPSVASEVEKKLPADYKPLLTWPEGTTGYYQLDKRIKQLGKVLNMLVYSASQPHLKQMLDTLIKEAKILSDDIHYISEKYKKREPNNPAWPALSTRIQEFQKLSYSLLLSNFNRKEVISNFCHKAASAWSRLHRKPVFKRSENQ
ncbi:response regulator [Alteromonas sp. ASW11-19]|uniref:Response regulator n=1 Tax=Alteromonas salexigens TaxID=2982530 RepID=A0ABT2VQ08_9ALTE|nr:response regulator [Alteromonas salexigens]MCU7555396.1 response regulator [Alteromonas salexigens]